METRYPIILVHGVMIKDIAFFKAFGRIEKVLKEAGYKVYTAKIDGLGTIEDNAKKLKDYLLFIMEKEHVNKVNLIAHSKGGLDSKYMIENLNMENKVASLTALCTPYKGSPIASWLLKLPNWIKKFIAFWLNFWYKIFGDDNPDALKVCDELKRIDKIEDEILNSNDKVYCQSYSSTIEKMKDDFIMSIPLTFSKFSEKLPTDGLVPEDSTKIGEYKGNAIDDEISHTQIVDFMVGKKKKEKIYKFYLSVCEDLANKGF